MEKIFEIFIRTTPERLWEAITDPAIRARYHFGAGVESDWTPGSRYTFGHPGADGPLAEGENLVVEPPRRLVQTMHVLWSDEAEREGTSRVTWEIEPVGDSCRLTVIHDQLERGGAGGDLRRVADDPVGVEDLARDRGDPHDPGLPHVQRALTVQKGDHHAADHHHRRPHHRRQGQRPGRRHRVLCRRPRLREADRRPDQPDHALDRGRARERPRPSRSTSTRGPGWAMDTGVRFTVPDAEAEHVAMRERGVNVGAVLRLDGVPPMFTFDDPDGNRFYVIEEPR